MTLQEALLEANDARKGPAPDGMTGCRVPVNHCGAELPLFTCRMGGGRRASG
ncbi:MAG TPA: hypothetical protein PLB97_07605 [Accumulibacter sp.]|nr:hypothetical protein [Accumulibacter sp.]HPP45955.1 hypothetical protein [Accumulibacter sp.]